MDSTYNFQLVRLFAKNILDGIGVEELYTKSGNNSGIDLFRLNKPGQIFEYIKRNSDLGSLIEIEDNEVNDSSLHGMFNQINNNGYIVINSVLNNCWKRFTKVKEICSLYVNHYGSEPERFTNYLDSITNAFERKEQFLSDDYNLGSEIDSETFAILMAMELMIPYHDRKTLIEYFEKVKKSEITLNDVAQALKMPEAVLDIYFKKEIHLIPPSIEDIRIVDAVAPKNI